MSSQTSSMSIKNMFAEHLLWAVLLQKLLRGADCVAQMGRVMITVPILERWSKQKTVCALTAMLLGYSEYLRYPFEVLVAQIPGMALCSNLSQPILLETSKNLNTKNKDLTFSCMLSYQEGENLYLALWEGFALLKELKDKDKLFKSYMEQREHSGLESKYLNLSYSIKGTKKKKKWFLSHIFSLCFSLMCACSRTHTHTQSLKSHTLNSTPWIWKEMEG